MDGLRARQRNAVYRAVRPDSHLHRIAAHMACNMLQHAMRQHGQSAHIGAKRPTKRRTSLGQSHCRLTRKQSSANFDNLHMGESPTPVHSQRRSRHDPAGAPATAPCRLQLCARARARFHRYRLPLPATGHRTRRRHQSERRAGGQQNRRRLPRGGACHGRVVEPPLHSLHLRCGRHRRRPLLPRVRVCTGRHAQGRAVQPCARRAADALHGSPSRQRSRHRSPGRHCAPRHQDEQCAHHLATVAHARRLRHRRHRLLPAVGSSGDAAHGRCGR